MFGSEPEVFQPLRSVSKLGLRTSVGVTVTWRVAVEDCPTVSLTVTVMV